jgi:hypothetical protein
MKKFSSFFLIFAFIHTLGYSFTNNEPAKSYYRLNYPHPNCGLFSAFRYVLSALKSYDDNIKTIAGLKIDFEKEGPYYDPLYGDNWWEYYCEPICLGSPKNAFIKSWIELPPCPMEFHTNRKETNYIISKYIKVKPHILQKVDNIVASQFTSYMIGIHYRGTDKVTEAHKVDYNTMANAISEFIISQNLRQFKIFVATDEENFLEFMLKKFPNRILCYEESYRSTNDAPIHFNESLNPYKKGEDAFIDCLLLSNCDHLIATCSHLSLCSTFFNPELSVRVLNNYKKQIQLEVKK